MHSDVIREGVAGGMVDAAEEAIRAGHGIAESAYMLADAMLEARKPKEGA